MTAQQERKKYIRAFMQNHYTDERLAMLLAHARDGKLEFQSCCCFIGVVTSPHRLRGEMPCFGSSGIIKERHYFDAQALDGGEEAEEAFRKLDGCQGEEVGDGAIRRRILIPMIRAEMRRREKLRPPEQPEAQPELTEAVAV